jgi:hypothetical protein
MLQIIGFISRDEAEKKNNTAGENAAVREEGFNDIWNRIIKPFNDKTPKIQN